MGDALLEQHAIRQAGQRIVKCLMRQLLLDRLAIGDVAAVQYVAVHGRVAAQVVDQDLGVHPGPVFAPQTELDRLAHLAGRHALGRGDAQPVGVVVVDDRGQRAVGHLVGRPSEHALGRGGAVVHPSALAEHQHDVGRVLGQRVEASALRLRAGDHGCARPLDAPPDREVDGDQQQDQQTPDDGAPEQCGLLTLPRGDDDVPVRLHPKIDRLEETRDQVLAVVALQAAEQGVAIGSSVDRVLEVADHRRQLEARAALLGGLVRCVGRGGQLLNPVGRAHQSDERPAGQRGLALQATVERFHLLGAHHLAQLQQLRPLLLAHREGRRAAREQRAGARDGDDHHDRRGQQGDQLNALQEAHAPGGGVPHLGRVATAVPVEAR
jgi:hypothetical protein